MPKDGVEGIGAFIREDRGLRVLRQVGALPDLRPGTPGDDGGRQPLGAPPVRESVQPTVGGRIRALAREPTSAAIDENEQNQSSG